MVFALLIMSTMRAMVQEGGLWQVAAMMAAPCIEDCERAKHAEQNFADGPFIMPFGQGIRVHALPQQQDKVRTRLLSKCHAYRLT